MLIRLLPFLLLVMGVSSCGSSGGGGERDKEKLRIVHSAPTLGKISVLKDEKTVTTNLSYGSATDYIELDEGASSIFSLRIDPEFIIPTLSVEESVVGPYKKTLLITESGGQPVLTFIADQTSTPPPSNESRIRFINAASIATSIDIYVTSPNTSLVNRSPVVSKLGFKETSDYFPASPGDYRIRVSVNAGTTSSSSASTDTSSSASTESDPSATGTAPDIDFDSGDYPIDAGEEVSFILIEKQGGGGQYSSLTLSASAW